MTLNFQVPFPHLIRKNILPAAISLLLVSGCGDQGSTKEAFQHERALVGEAMGQVLKERQPGVRVMVLTRPALADNPLDAPEKAFLSSLKEVLGSNFNQAEITLSPGQLAEIEEQAENADIPENEMDAFRNSMLRSPSSWFLTANLRRFMEDHQQEADVVISMIGLPLDLTAQNFPEGDRLPAFAALNLSTWEAFDLLKQRKGRMYQAFRSGKNSTPPPGIQTQAVGEESLLLYPSSGTR